MSLIEQCPICKGNVSYAAKTCPHCGHPFREGFDKDGYKIKK